MNHVLFGDCRASMRGLIAKGVKVNMVVTSPPYWGLRSYLPADHPLKAFELGQESTPEAYVNNMVEVFRLVRELMHDDGTLWLNLGDTYVTVPHGPRGVNAPDQLAGARGRPGRGQSRMGYEGKHAYADSSRNNGEVANRRPVPGLKHKDLVGIPWRVAFALQADGWYLRRDIIWDKKNCMPESVTDRPTTSHEYIFLLSKSPSYYYDHEAIKEPQEESERSRRLKEHGKGLDSMFKLRRDEPHGQTRPGSTGVARSSRARQELALRGTRNKRSVWHIEESEWQQFLAWREWARTQKRDVWRMSTQPYDDAHFAVFPDELPKIGILAGTSARGHCPKCGAGWERVMGESLPAEGQRSWNKERKDRSEHGGAGGRATNQAFGVPWLPQAPQTAGWSSACECHLTVSCGARCELEPVPGIVFDPFTGSGTTAKVALDLGRRYLGCDINEAYGPMQWDRTVQTGLALA